MKKLSLLIIIFPLFSTLLFGDFLSSVNKFYGDIFGNEPDCLKKSEDPLKENWGDFSTLSNKAIKKINDFENTESDSSWIPFVETRETIQNDFNDILDDLIISLTGDSRAMRCLEEMRLNSKKIIEESEKILKLKENSLLNLTEEEKAEVEKSLKEIERLKSSGEKLRLSILEELKSLGMDLKDSELNALLVRVDSDDILQMMMIFDISKKIISQLQKLMLEGGDDIKLSRRYYGMNLVLSEIALFVQERYISAINQKYIPKLKEIIAKIEDLQKETEILQKSSKNSYEKDIYSKNLQAQKLTLKTANLYIKNLEKQRKQVSIAKDRSLDNLNLTRNSYRTLQIGVNLLDLIKSTEESFQRVMDIQFPEIIPFENSNIEREYKKLTDELRKD
jgi:hypothetical protein